MFSDESSVTVPPKTPRKLVWRAEGERHKTFNLISSFKSGYVGISIWAGFSTLGRLQLVLIDGTFNKEKYQNILEAQVIPFATKHYGSIENFTFQ